MVRTIKIKTPQERKIEELEKENSILKANLENLNSKTSFHEELIIELAMVLYEP